MNKSFLFAVATLVGAIVGLGMFGIPYAVMKAGFWVGFGYLVLLGGVTLLLHLMQGEIVERTEGHHRLPGYVEKYLGKKWKNILGVAIIFSIYTALLAYIIVGGKFLALLFPETMNNVFVLSIVFWFVLSLLVWRGIRTVAEVELLMTGLMVLFVVILIGWGGRHIELDNFTGGSLGDLFLPYGVILFAFSGLFAIPEIRELLKGDGRAYKRAIVWGTCIPGIIYFFFMLVVVGVSGAHTSEEALTGLTPYLGKAIVSAGAVFGLLAIATSYLVLGVNMKRTFEYDWRLGSNASSALALFAPLVLFLVGIQQFVTVISVSGAVFGAITGLVVIFVYRKVTLSSEKKSGFSLRIPRFVQWGMSALFLLGGIYEIIYLLNF